MIYRVLTSRRNLLLFKMGRFTYFLLERACSCRVFQRSFGTTSGFSSGISLKTWKDLSKYSLPGVHYLQLSLQFASLFLVGWGVWEWGRSQCVARMMSFPANTGSDICSRMTLPPCKHEGIFSLQLSEEAGAESY